MNPLTRWQIGGAAGGGVDTDVPPLPVFGLNLAGQGTIELVGIAFTRSDEYAYDFGGNTDAVLLG